MSNYSAALLLEPFLQFNSALALIERQLQIIIIFFWRLSIRMSCVQLQLATIFTTTMVSASVCFMFPEVKQMSLASRCEDGGLERPPTPQEGGH